MSTALAIEHELRALRLALTARGVAAELGQVNWTYDGENRRVEALSAADVVIMGFNAGGGGRGSEAKWRNKCARLSADFPNGFMLAELILIASRNVGALMEHGNLDRLVADCAGVNRAVIAHHRPKVIIHTGFDALDAVRQAYGLTEKAERQKRPAHPTHTLLRHFEMEDGTPWLSIKHPSSWGFSTDDIRAIRAYASMVGGRPKNDGQQPY